MTPAIHWLGAGLSSTPGILRLEAGPCPPIVWARTLAKARHTLSELNADIDIRRLDWRQLRESIAPGDVLVSMLPATKHLEVAELCLQQGAHFVSSSYLSPEMSGLHERAESLRLCLVNEVGLDPGIDHLLAHSLVDQYQRSEHFSPRNQHFFRSYCGGFPKTPNEFRYKFSWSPLGVLRALKSPSKWIAGGEIKTSRAPWHALTTFTARFPGGDEEFEAFANRDSLPFLRQYGFGEDWDVREFVRGTLRLAGWSTAWRAIFDELDQLAEDAAEQRMVELSRELEEKYSYHPGEPDRVALCVELEVHRDQQVVWHRSCQLDSHGNAQGQAMARLVSWPVSFAVDSILRGELPAGVSAAPDNPQRVTQWLAHLESLGETISRREGT
ncbi:MAG: saccharopine dehydrogenase NADP-binding domain-containing protein [Akkermansiaceae bacterium]|nr:saccharopine dehydrogenase NADP-binding domain-containing protein [Akkermansiaceae bacterium]